MKQEIGVELKEIGWEVGRRKSKYLKVVRVVDRDLIREILWRMPSSAEWLFEQVTKKW